MDDNMIELFASKLNINPIQLKKCYEETIEELSNIQLCSYKFSSGKNKGLLCGSMNKKSVIKNTLDNKYYCKTHNTSIEKKELKKSVVKIVNNKIPTILHNIDKIETEKMGDLDVIKGTLLIVDKSKNCCIGKLIDNHPNEELTEDDQNYLKELNIEF